MSERLGRLPKDYEPSNTAPPQVFGPRQPEPFVSMMADPTAFGNINRTSSSMRSPVKGAAAAVQTGAFYGMYQDEAGDTYLQGGGVDGGAGTSGPPLGPKLLYTQAQKTAADGGTPLPYSGQHLYVKITVDGVKNSGVMLPGLKVTDAEYHGPTSTAPTSDTPTVDSTTGKFLYENIGYYTDTDFLPAESGNISAGGCFGSYYWGR